MMGRKRGFGLAVKVGRAVIFELACWAESDSE